MPLREIARAKVNLTLTVHGRRADGYHELESLVTFADVGDVVTLLPSAAASLATVGPFAGDIDGPNLLARVLTLLERAPGLQQGTITLEKNLPVAAGLGGGSADAAALLRALRRANPERSGTIPWHEIAVRLGADVPVCLAGMPALMRGIGDAVEPRAGSGSLPAVLVNPRVALATPRVFAALGAGPIPVGWRRSPPPAQLQDLAALIAHVREHGNDLEAPAIRLLPVIAETKAALAAQPGCLYAAMSGSGPTCFGLFDTAASAARAAAAIARASLWWIAETQLDRPA